MKRSYFLLLLIIFSIYSCKKEKGCVTENAMNYNSDAKKDDGSCIYVSDIAPGLWHIDPSCEEILIPQFDQNGDIVFPLQFDDTIKFEELLADSINVLYNSGDSYYIDIFGLQIEGKIDNNGVINIPRKSIEFEDFEIPIELDGSGKINEDATGQINLNLYILTGIAFYPEIQYNPLCVISLSKN